MLFSLILFVAIIGAIAFTVFFLLRMFDSIKTVEEQHIENERKQQEINMALNHKLENTLDIDNINKLETKIENVKSLIEQSKTGVEDLKSRQLDEIAERLNQMENSEEERMMRLIKDMEKELIYEMAIINDNNDNIQDRIQLIEKSLAADDEFLGWDDFVDKSNQSISDLQENDIVLQEIVQDTNQKISGYINNYDKETRQKETSDII